MRLSHFSPFRKFLNGFAVLPAGQIKLVCALQVHPRNAEVPRKAQSRVRGYVPFPCQDLVKPVRRHLNDVGQLLCCKTYLLEFVGENFSGMYRRACDLVFSFRLVIINNFYVRRAGLVLRPLKADAPHGH